MRVYISADSSHQEDMRALKAALRVHEIYVNSRWLDADLTGKNLTPTEWEEAAEEDLADVEDCHVFIAYNPVETQKQGTGGRHVELGYAIACARPIIYIGEKLENVFHRIPLVKAVISKTKPIGAVAELIAIYILRIKQETRRERMR